MQPVEVGELVKACNTVERLRQSVETPPAMPFESGFDAGMRWAASTAHRDELRRLRAFVEDIMDGEWTSKVFKVSDDYDTEFTDLEQFVKGFARGAVGVWMFVEQEVRYPPPKPKMTA